MKKIFIDKNESIKEVIEKIAASTDFDVVLVFPRHTKLRNSAANFQIIKKEAAAQKKNIIIESVDEEVLALAQAAQIEGIHPLFSGSRAKSLSDIVPSAGSVLREPPKKGKRGASKNVSSKKNKKVSLKVTEDTEDAEDDFEAEETMVEAYEEMTVSVPGIIADEDEVEDTIPRGLDGTDEYSETYDEPRRRARWPYVLTGFLLVAAGAAWALGAFFSRADAVVNFRTIPWKYDGEIVAVKAAEGTDVERQIIPAESFSDSRTVTQLFKASGRAEVKQKAKGRITIFNAYSSQAQTLVATTRFLAPDGKIYRLDEQVEIPGAEVKDGKIIPSSITAAVSGDQPGPDFNTGPIERLSIPGFKGTAKYDGFYGTLQEGTKDGFIGERAVPTDEDIAAARTRTIEILRSSLQSNILSRRPTDFKILDDAMTVEVVRLTVNPNTDANGSFSVFGEARFRAVGFRESDVERILLAKAVQENPNIEFHELNMAYEKSAVNYEAGRLEMKVKATGSLATEFSEDDFRKELAGKDLASARGMVTAIAGRSARSESNISIWPIWIRRVPTEVEKINLRVGYESAD